MPVSGGISGLAVTVRITWTAPLVRVSTIGSLNL
jgi:hypothetical protein